MAQKVAIELEDDLDGGPADETVRFGYDGAEYEIDLSAANARAFRNKLAPFIERARTPSRSTARRTARTTAGRQRSAEARAWAREHGLAVSARGRIPASVLAQYEAATKGRLVRRSQCRRSLAPRRPVWPGSVVSRRFHGRWRTVCPSVALSQGRRPVWRLTAREPIIAGRDRCVGGASCRLRRELRTIGGASCRGR